MPFSQVARRHIEAVRVPTLTLTPTPTLALALRYIRTHIHTLIFFSYRTLPLGQCGFKIGGITP